MTESIIKPTDIHSKDLRIALWDFSREMHLWHKHGLSQDIKTPHETLEFIIEHFNDMIGPYIEN